MRPILVTGGAKRLGAAICKELAARGRDVLIHYNRSEVEAKALAKSSSHFALIQADFTQPLDDFIAEVKERFPNLCGLVNNVGNYEKGVSSLPSLLQVNLAATVELTNSLVPLIVAQKGAIVNLGVAGLTHPWTEAVGYGMSKAALLFYTRSLAKQLSSSQVSVNMVSPGQTENSVDLPGSLPMGRPASEKEVASLVASLFEESHHYITGQNIEIAGGHRL